MVAALEPFVTEEYYYMFLDANQSISAYRSYILGTDVGVGRGLNRDFGNIELWLDGQLAAISNWSQPTST